MVFVHFKIISPSLRSFFTPLRFKNRRNKGFLFPVPYSSDYARLFIFADSYQHVFEELNAQMSDGVLDNLKYPSILYIESSADSYASTSDVFYYCLQEMEDSKQYVFSSIETQNR